MSLDYRPIVFAQPRAYKPEYCDMLIQHMSQGLSFDTFGAAVGVSKKVLRAWLDAEPDFRDAREIGDSYLLLFWERMGVAGAAGKLKNFTCRAWEVNMRVRFKDTWRDDIAAEEAHQLKIFLAYDDSKPIEHTKLTE